MALVLDATVGGAAANSFCARAEADAILEGHPYASAWTALLGAAKDQLLVHGTRLLVALYEWNGTATTDTQALPFPRVGLLTRNGYPIGSATIPADLKTALAYLAAALAEGGDPYALGDAQAEGVTSIKAGSVALTFSESVSLSMADAIPVSVSGLIPASWGYLRGRSGTRPLVRA